MATSLIRKVWDSVSHRSRPNSAPSSPRIHFSSVESTSAGPFDQIPVDIIVHILKLLGPNEAAKLSLVCKYWRFLVSDNSLWVFFLENQNPEFSSDSVFFSETCLFLAYPLRCRHLPSQTPQLSMKHIYGKRAQVTGSIVLDGGSGYCKFGWSRYASPSGRSATFLEFGNIETPLLSRLQHFFSTIYSRMQVNPSTQPIVLSLPICHYDDTESAQASRMQLKETIYSALFDLKVPAVCAINQATLALFAAKQTSGIVVNIGFHQTSVVPILHGKVMRRVGVEVVGLGALKLTGFLKEQMQHIHMEFDSLYTVRTLKENLCYVAFDYEAELSKHTEASLRLSEGCYTLIQERFKTGEILFQPRICGMRAMGLHQAVALCMEHCEAAELPADDSWFKTIVLAGGSACLPGLAARLEKELHGLLPLVMTSGLRVIPPPYGVDSAWFGAKLVSNLSTFPGPWCITKKQFRQKSRRQHLLRSC